MEYLVYKHTSPSGKSYIGITNDYIGRCWRHQNTTGCRAFALAIQKYGWDALTHEILLEGLTLEEANEAEQRLIAEHNTLSPNGYNLTTGGGVRKLSNETRARMAAVKIGKAKGPVSQATREKISATLSKQWICTDPDGVEHQVINLTKFCKAHGLDMCTMTKVALGRYKHHKRWKCIKVG